MFNSSGQGLAIDMTLAVFLLFLVLGGLLAAWNNNLETVALEQLNRDLNSRANQVMELLVRSEGIPPNWETLPTPQVSSIGLAYTDRVVDETKLNAFKNLTVDYDSVRDIFRLGTFHYFFSLEGVDDVNAGLPTTADAYKVTLTRIVNYKGEEARATLTIYQLR